MKPIAEDDEVCILCGKSAVFHCESCREPICNIHTWPFRSNWNEQTFQCETCHKKWRRNKLIAAGIVIPIFLVYQFLLWTDRLAFLFEIF